MAIDPNFLIQGLLRGTGFGQTQGELRGQDIQNQQGQQNLQAGALQLQAAHAAQAQEQQYQADIGDYFKDPRPQKLAMLAAKYPQKADALKQVYSVQNDQQRQSALGVMGGLYNAADAGRADIVTKNLTNVRDAERAQGIDTSEVDGLLADLNSGDAAKVKSAVTMTKGFAQMHLAAINPDKFNETYGVLGKGGEDKGFTLHQGETRFDGEGNPIASASDAPKYMTVKNADGSESIVQVGGGGQASGSGGGTPNSTTASPRYTGPQIEQTAVGAIPGIGVSSRMRTRAEQAALYAKYVAYKSGKGPWAPLAAPPGSSDHEKDRARDFTPPEGMSMAQLHTQLQQTFPGAQVINEGNHVHVGAGPVSAAPAAKFNDNGTRILFTSKGNPGGASGTAPSGFRFKGDGTLEAIPGGPADAELLTPDAITSMAQQYLAGDKAVMQNLGRGKQGAANIVKLRGEIARQAAAAGMSGRDIAAQMADFSGVVASERATGTRIAAVELAATEAEKLIPLALQASQALPRNGFLPFSRAEQAIRSGINDPKMRRFVTANQALVNVYSRAVSPSGAPTVSDKEHARQLLDTAYDQPSYQAVVTQMQQEIAAARAAPRSVRAELRDNVGGGVGQPPTGAPSAAVQFLRAHPELRAKFDAKYGPGSAARALGR